MAKKKEEVKPWHGSLVSDVRLRIPADVVMLCKLVDTSPENLLQGFLSCLAVENNKKNPEAAKHASIDFFIHYGLGAAYYTEEEMRQMFTELRRVNELWLDELMTSKFIDQHAHWRRRYYKRWFKKWHWKIRRRNHNNTLNF